MRDNSRPAEFNIDNCYPNPFNPATKISFSIFSSAKIAGGNNSEYFVSERVTVKIFDILGREICTLMDEEKSAGKYTVNWNAANAPAGVFFCRIKCGGKTKTNKLVLLK